jgi:transcriptional regulator with XRE-family HTH domain
MDLVQVFGRNVQERRRALGLTQEDLEGLTGLRRSYISDMERGRRNPTIKALQRLAEALQTEPAELVRWPADAAKAM